MAFDGTYYKVYEFKELYFQRNNAGAIAETAFPWPNAMKPASEQQTYEWQGGAAKKKITVLIAQNFTIDLDAVPSAAHFAVFGKTEITDAGAADAFFDVSTLIGIGGGNDTAGVTRGVRAVANALAGDSESVVELNIWIPVATITVAAAGGFNSGGIGDKFQYAISCTKTTLDITGTAIAGASTDGEFFFFGVGV